MSQMCTVTVDKFIVLQICKQEEQPLEGDPLVNPLYCQPWFQSVTSCDLFSISMSIYSRLVVPIDHFMTTLVAFKF